MFFPESQILPWRDGGRGGGVFMFLLFGRGRVSFAVWVGPTPPPNSKKARRPNRKTKKEKAKQQKRPDNKVKSTLAPLVLLQCHLRLSFLSRTFKVQRFGDASSLTDTLRGPVSRWSLVERNEALDPYI